MSQPLCDLRLSVDQFARHTGHTRMYTDGRLKEKKRDNTHTHLDESGWYTKKIMRCAHTDRSAAENLKIFMRALTESVLWPKLYRKDGGGQKLCLKWSWLPP